MRNLFHLGGRKMKSNFLGCFTRNQTRKNEETEIVEQVGDIQFKIVSDTVSISPLEADHIVKIVCDELEKVTLHTGQFIAMRITEEVNRKKICTAQVSRGTDGKEWLIKVSNNPLEFID